MIDRMRPAEAGFGLAVVRPLRSFAGSRGGCGRLDISLCGIYILGAGPCWISSPKRSELEEHREITGTDLLVPHSGRETSADTHLQTIRHRTSHYCQDQP